MNENTSAGERLEDKKDDEDDDLEGIVYENCGRFSAAARFLDEANAESLKPFKGLEWGALKVATWISYPFAYVFSFLCARYSSKKRGYVF